MAVGQPFMYDAVPVQTAGRPYNSFDPRAVSRASLAPKVERPKSNGPLISFNQHPDSYLILPYGNTSATAMSPSSKKRIIQTRVAQLVLRVLELLGAIGSLGLLILISGLNASTAWIMRIPPGFAILHTVYAIYHLSRKAAGRTPASSASYMIFASCFDITLIPFYVFSALMIVPQYKLALAGSDQAGQWTTLVPITPAPMRLLTGIAFLCTTISGGLHVVSLILSIYLAVMFRKIVNLPPDMNPLEDNLTSRHKRNKSELTVSTTSEKRLSTPLESRFSSGAPYEDLSRPPSIPFLHTRTASSDSFTSSKSRSSTIDLPDRQYQLPSSHSTSPVNTKRGPQTRSSSPLKHTSYSEIPLSEAEDTPSTPVKEAWFRTEALSVPSPTDETAIPKRDYQPIHQRNDSDTGDISLLFPSNHPNPLCANPPSPRVPNSRSTPVSAPQTQRSAHSQAQPARQPLPNPFTRNNSPSTSRTALALSSLAPSNVNARKSSSNYSGDLGDASTVSDLSFTENDDGAAAELDTRRVQSSAFPTFTKAAGAGRSQPQIYEAPHRGQRQEESRGYRQPATKVDGFRAKQYGDLRAATPPIMLNVHGSSVPRPMETPAGPRQASSGNDYRRSWGMRDISGKVAEEGRGDENWGTRFRKVSGVVATTDRLGGW